ncbi:helix-turn-helix domain-containing protein [Methylobacterium segetis]|uniref:helix-turn-helix domain-containing protein n=1 Tax=Methylobacterium segetis TaxID=2488750 RepID=UPI00104374EA|nr:helix-turn-helix transcriptional regulator [Methylobacterium segetis]
MTAISTLTSRESLRIIEAQGLAGSWSWHFASGEQRWSGGLYALLGLPRGLRPDYGLLRGLVHPDDRGRLPGAADLARIGGLDDSTVRILRRDGTMRVAASRAEGIRSPEGRPLGVAGVMVDITDTDRLVRARAAEQHRRQALARQARIFTFTEAVVPFVEYGSDFLAFTGRSREELAENWAAPAVPEDWGRWHAEVPDLYAAGRAYTISPTLRMAEGGTAPFRFTMVPIRDEAGMVCSWTMIIVPVGAAAGPPPDAVRRGLEEGIEGRHLRAARALLDWSMADLARASGLSFSTIRRLEEDGGGAPARSHQRAVETLRQAGIGFSLVAGNAIALSRTG